MIFTLLPLSKKEGVKGLIFTILSREYPLKIIELTNFIRKRYGKSVTFQAVRKAVLQLFEEGVLMKESHEFSVSKEWVLQTKAQLDKLYEALTKQKTAPKSVDSIKEEMSVFIFGSLNDLMRFWEDLVDDWFKNFKKGDYNVNCWQGAHAWEVILYADRETKVFGQLKKKNIVSYALSTGNTPLDRNAWRFCRSIGINTQISPSSSSFDKQYYVGTYGDLIIQAHYPQSIVEALERFFRTNKSIEELNLKELSEIVNKPSQCKLSVIRNIEMAKHINKSILSQMG